jgi:eukaryotic-like serine/threonine-protein kinase
MTTRKRRYDLQRELGRGAAGTVWAAWDTQLERQVAIKLLHADSPDGAAELQRFETEARAIAQLPSPHIVRVYDAGSADGQPFMVMELLEGENLESRLSRHHRLPLSMVSNIVAEVSKGLSVTHRAGIIHRDVKPANVFLAQEGGREVAKLLDFGVATLMAQSRAVRADPDNAYWIGTPQYMSPEQITGGSLDGRSDLWALAVMTYRMLTGVCPFTGTTLLSLTEHICSASFEAPSTLKVEVDPRLDVFFARALSKKPCDRFQCADDFATELSAVERAERSATRVLFLDDEPDMELLLRQRFRREVREGLYDLHFATDGRSGLDALRLGPFDVVVTDLNMPGMDGLTFLDQVPDLDPFVRVVVVSAYGDMANIRAAMNRGAFDFLGKPIDFNDLQATIEKCAAHASVVRRALQSTEENELMRVLLGQGVAERWLTALRNPDAPSHLTTSATVVFVDVHGFARTLCDPFPADAFERLNEYFALFIRELQAKEGKVSRFVGDAVLAVFEGAEHLSRAIDACLAIRLRLRAYAAQTSTEPMSTYGVSIGLDTGVVVAGPAGSRALGHVEPSLLGETVSTAARLQALAGKDELLISTRALRQVAASYQCEEDAQRTIQTGEGVTPVVSVIRKRNVEAVQNQEHGALAWGEQTQSQEG